MEQSSSHSGSTVVPISVQWGLFGQILVPLGANGDYKAVVWILLLDLPELGILFNHITYLGALIYNLLKSLIYSSVISCSDREEKLIG